MGEGRPLFVKCGVKCPLGLPCSDFSSVGGNTGLEKQKHSEENKAKGFLFGCPKAGRGWVAKFPLLGK